MDTTFMNLQGVSTDLKFFSLPEQLKKPLNAICFWNNLAVAIDGQWCVLSNHPTQHFHHVSTNYSFTAQDLPALCMGYALGLHATPADTHDLVKKAQQGSDGNDEEHDEEEIDEDKESDESEDGADADEYEEEDNEDEEEERSADIDEGDDDQSLGEDEEEDEFDTEFDEEETDTDNDGYDEDDEEDYDFDEDEDDDDE
jgi:hypothetical protein